MIDYSVALQSNPQKPDEPKKAYAHAQVTDSLDLFAFARLVEAHSCKYDEGDVLAILTMTVRRIRECLLRGRKVRLGKLGDFWLTLSSDGATSKATFTEQNITSVNILFTPGRYLQNLRKDAGLEITDRITITIAPNSEVDAAVKAFGDYIKAQVLADSITIAENDGIETEFDEFKVNILINKSK